MKNKNQDLVAQFRFCFHCPLMWIHLKNWCSCRLHYSVKQFECRFHYRMFEILVQFKHFTIILGQKFSQVWLSELNVTYKYFYQSHCSIIQYLSHFKSMMTKTFDTVGSHFLSFFILGFNIYFFFRFLQCYLMPQNQLFLLRY